MVEAVPEIEALKLDTFRMIDKVVTDPTAVLASNTSSIPIMKLAMATERPEQVIGIHFFNPVPVLPLVELVPSLLTSADVVEEAAAFASTPARQARDPLPGPGRVRRQRPADPLPPLGHPDARVRVRHRRATSTTGMVQGCAHPMGPLALADLIGLDTMMAVAESMYEEFKEPLYAPPPMLSRMVDAGLLGRKSGRGFHQYT